MLYYFGSFTSITNIGYLGFCSLCYTLLMYNTFGDLKCTCFCFDFLSTKCKECYKGLNDEYGCCCVIPAFEIFQQTVFIWEISFRCIFCCWFVSRIVVDIILQIIKFLCCDLMDNAWFMWIIGLRSSFMFLDHESLLPVMNCIIDGVRQ